MPGVHGSNGGNGRWNGTKWDDTDERVKEKEIR